MAGLAYLELGAGIVPLGLLVLLIVAVTGGRNEPDPTAERPAAIYYAGVFFVTLFTALFAVFAVVASLLNLTTHDHSRAFGYSVRQSITVNGELRSIAPSPLVSRSIPGENDADYANALRGLLIAGVAVGVYVFHDRRRRDQLVGPVGSRVERTYQYAVSFVSVVIYVIAGAMALYAIVQILGPGLTRVGTRGDAAVKFGQSLFLAAAAGAIFQIFLGQADRRSRSAPSSALLVPEPPPPVLPDDDFRQPRATRKAAPARKTAPAKKAAKAAKKTTKRS